MVVTWSGPVRGAYVPGPVPPRPPRIEAADVMRAIKAIVEDPAKDPLIESTDKKLHDEKAYAESRGLRQLSHQP